MYTIKSYLKTRIKYKTQKSKKFYLNFHTKAGSVVEFTAYEGEIMKKQHWRHLRHMTHIALTKIDVTEWVTRRIFNTK